MLITEQAFKYQPAEYEQEKASNVYLMSLVAAMVGLPLPIVNLIATSIFYLANRRSTYFVRFHCTQALLSQLFLIVMNSAALSWTIAIAFGDTIITNAYISYMITIFLFNLIEFTGNIYSAIRIRKGKHMEFYFFGSLASLLCKP